MSDTLPLIPDKKYFTIGEVSQLCSVKPYVLRYWEQEFTQLRPLKRRGNRRYYQHHEVLLVRHIRALLYDQGFTISGARNKLVTASLEVAPPSKLPQHSEGLLLEDIVLTEFDFFGLSVAPEPLKPCSVAQVRVELLSIRELLNV
jgi:DNA-binding transcriptional MerR regulator